MIKKGNVNAQQLSQIMLGELDLANFIEEDQVVVAPLMVAPVMAAPVVVAPVMATPVVAAPV
jgi:hypothetical protein